MNKKLLFFIVSVSIVIATIILQSIVFPMIFTHDYMADISLIAIIYFSINYGKNIGQVMGFSSGLLLDSLSGVPFGLNALVRVIMGYLLGFFNGVVFLDRIILPCVIITICTISKYILFYLVSVIFPIEFSINIFSLKYGIELVLNIVLTPIFFMLLNLLAKRLNPRRDSI